MLVPMGSSGGLLWGADWKPFCPPRGRDAIHDRVILDEQRGVAISDSVIPGWSEGPDLGCAIAHRGISRFRVRCFASPRNDNPQQKSAEGAFPSSCAFMQ